MDFILGFIKLTRWIINFHIWGAKIVWAFKSFALLDKEIKMKGQTDTMLLLVELYWFKTFYIYKKRKQLNSTQKAWCKKIYGGLVSPLPSHFLHALYILQVWDMFLGEMWADKIVITNKQKSHCTNSVSTGTMYISDFQR